MAALLALAVCALLLARLVRWRGAWRWIAAALVAAILAAQLLPAGHPFRAEAAAWGKAAFWLGVAAVPIGVYAAWLRRLRRRTGADAPTPAHPRGLVLFPKDAALAAETAAELLAAAPGDRLTLGWRGAENALEGVLRLRFAGDLAEVELFRAPAPASAAALVAAAEREAMIRGAARIGVLAPPWQAEAPFLRAGFTPLAEAGGRRWLEKRL